MAPSFVLPPLWPLLNMTAFQIQNSSRKHTATFILPIFLGFWPLSHTRYEPTNLLCTHFAPLCIINCLFNKEEEASGWRDIWWSEEKGRHWLNGVRQQFFPWAIQHISVLPLNGRKVPPNPCKSCYLHPVTSDLQKITVQANDMLWFYAI